MQASSLPEWNLSALYDGVEDRNYKKLKRDVTELAREFAGLGKDNGLKHERPAEWLERAIKKYNRLGDVFEELDAFVTMWYTTNTTDEKALAELNELEELGLAVNEAEVLVKNGLAEIAQRLPEIFEQRPELREYRYFLEEQLFFQQHQMSVDEESLAADLMRSGGSAWGRLFQAVSSTASAEWEQADGEASGAGGDGVAARGAEAEAASGGEEEASGTRGEAKTASEDEERTEIENKKSGNGNIVRKTVTELRGLAFDPDRDVRRKAWRKELEAVRQVELPLAAAINGVKGFTVSLNRHRGYESALEKSIRQARISRSTLDALIGVMEESLPVFRNYLKGKAKLLGVDRLGFYDLFAPVGKDVAAWSYDAARDFIVEHFRTFSGEMAGFAEHAFAEGWIDARPRPGKVGGAYCISLPVTGETRVLSNFSGNFGDVKTLAHELGHAYHYHVLRDAPHISRQYPMTLAETASIFAESVVIDGALKTAKDEQKLPIVEKLLQDSTQVIVDILSRFKFEKEVLQRRRTHELSPKELKDLMLTAQLETYGEALNQEELHPYMWEVKPHYYRTELAYYNFPYAFGHLFGLGLYSRYQNEGESFLPVYRELLQKTGKMSAVEVTASAGFDIERPDFWREGIRTINGRVEEFLSFV